MQMNEHVLEGSDAAMVKLSGLRVDMIEIPLKKKFYGSTYAIDRRCTILLTVRLDNGLECRIHTGDARTGADDIASHIKEMAPILLGRSLSEIGSLWDQLKLGSKLFAYDYVQRGRYMRALAAINSGLWDALARQAGVPLYSLLGGRPRALPAVCIGGYYSNLNAGVDEQLALISEETRVILEMGFAGIKLKVGQMSPEEDLARLRRVREIAGDSFMIACDANRAWTFDEALTFYRGAEECHIAWFEEPVVWFDEYRGMRDLNRRGPIPVCAGQSEMSHTGLVDLLDVGCISVMNLDASVCGGPTAWSAAAEIAVSRGVGLTHHEEPQQALQLLNSKPGALCVEFFHPDRDPVWWEMVTSKPGVANGLVTPPDGPGYGIDYDDEIVDRFTVASIAM
jgi:D-galactarolactone cycloisomerase